MNNDFWLELAKSLDVERLADILISSRTDRRGYHARGDCTSDARCLVNRSGAIGYSGELVSISKWVGGTISQVFAAEEIKQVVEGGGDTEMMKFLVEFHEGIEWQINAKRNYEAMLKADKEGRIGEWLRSQLPRDKVEK